MGGRAAPPRVTIRANAALSGSGFWAVYQAAFMAELEKRGWEFPNLVGTSGGSLVAAGVAAGYRAQEMLDMIASMNQENFMDWYALPLHLQKLPGAVASFTRRVPVTAQQLIDDLPAPLQSPLKNLPVMLRRVGVAVTGAVTKATGMVGAVFNKQGAFAGDVMEKFMYDKLFAKGIVSWEDLEAKIKTGDASNLQIIGYGSNRSIQLTFPRQALEDVLGYDHETAMKQEIAKAVRVSASAFMAFRPVEMKDACGRTWIASDGGPANNLGYEQAKDMDPTIPTIGIDMSKPEHYRKFTLGWLPQFAKLAWNIGVESNGAQERGILATSGIREFIDFPALSGDQMTPLTAAQQNDMVALATQRAATFDTWYRRHVLPKMANKPGDVDFRKWFRSAVPGPAASRSPFDAENRERAFGRAAPSFLSGGAG